MYFNIQLVRTTIDDYDSYKSLVTSVESGKRNPASPVTDCARLTDTCGKDSNEWVSREVKLRLNYQIDRVLLAVVT